MKHETSGLTGVFLNAAVAKAQRLKWEICGDTVFADWCTEEKAMAPYHPSTGPALGQKILREAGVPFTGDLVADLRAYVARELGATVELGDGLPDSLLMQCIRSGQASAEQVAAHVAAGDLR
jgi:hypothetical protein